MHIFMGGHYLTIQKSLIGKKQHLRRNLRQVIGRKVLLGSQELKNQAVVYHLRRNFLIGNVGFSYFPC